MIYTIVCRKVDKHVLRQTIGIISLNQYKIVPTAITSQKHGTTRKSCINGAEFRAELLWSVREENCRQKRKVVGFVFDA